MRIGEGERGGLGRIQLVKGRDKDIVGFGGSSSALGEPNLRAACRQKGAVWVVRVGAALAGCPVGISRGKGGLGRLRLEVIVGLEGRGFGAS